MTLYLLVETLSVFKLAGLTRNAACIVAERKSRGLVRDGKCEDVFLSHFRAQVVIYITSRRFEV